MGMGPIPERPMLLMSPGMEEMISIHFFVYPCASPRINVALQIPLSSTEMLPYFFFLPLFSFSTYNLWRSVIL